MTAYREVFSHLAGIYGKEPAQEWTAAFMSLIKNLEPLLQSRQNGHPSQSECLDRHSSILITYADSIQPGAYRPDADVSKKEAPLATLTRFLAAQVGRAISSVHLLPFYPASSDDGFSVIEPLTVDPVFGSWKDVRNLSDFYLLMFDLVANHLSRSNHWIRAYCAGVKEFADFAIEMTGNEDLSAVFRPRALPLLTTLDTADGPKKVWTTFSPDQIDLNYHNPKVLLIMTEILLTYIARGASLIRLDAVAFIWKELGTSCIHQEKTHAIIRFMRWLIDRLAPGTGIITETNVPHAENISYFGNGSNEASMVYNFPLPPLVFHTFLTQNAEKLQKWAASLEFPSDSVTYFNFLASHDGIGLVPAKGILERHEIQAMADHVLKQGGFVSFRNEPDGSTSPYELNCSYLSALSGLEDEETDALRAARFIAAQAIMLSLRGVPGIYIHSLLGSENWLSYADLKAHPRRINREKLSIDLLEQELANPGSIRSLIFNAYLRLLNVRRREPAFTAACPQRVLSSGNSQVFALLRTCSNTAACREAPGNNPSTIGVSDDMAAGIAAESDAGTDSERLLVLINVSAGVQEVSLGKLIHPARWHDLLGDNLLGDDLLGDDQLVGNLPGGDGKTGRHYSGSETISLKPYQVLWLRADYGPYKGSNRS